MLAVLHDGVVAEELERTDACSKSTLLSHEIEVKHENYHHMLPVLKDIEGLLHGTAEALSEEVSPGGP